MPEDRPLIVMVQAMSGLRGPAQTLLEFVRYLQPRRDVIVALPEGALADRLRGFDAKVLALPRRSGRTGSWFRGARRLRAEVDRIDRPIVFHANGLSALNLAVPAARSREAPVLVHCHDYEIVPSTRRALRLWRGMHLQTRFVSVSEFTRGLLEGTGAVPSVAGVLPNPIVCANFEIDGAEAHDPFRVGFVGGGEPRKGLDHLVTVADLLRTEPIEYHVFGIDRAATPRGYVGKCVERIQQLDLSDRFRWHGWTDDVPAAYASVDAVLIPSRKESFGRVAIEGMASGLPVIAPRISGLSEVVWDGVSGMLYEPDCLEEAASLLRRIASDTQLRARLRSGALEAVRRFDISVVGATLLRHHDALLDVSEPSRVDVES